MSNQKQINITADQGIRETFNKLLDEAFEEYQKRGYGERKVFGSVSSAFSNMKRGKYPGIERACHILLLLGYEISFSISPPEKEDALDQ